MNIDEVSAMWQTDSELNPQDLTMETVRTPKLIDKYYRIYVREGFLLKKLRANFGVLKKAKTAWYSGTMDEIELRARDWKPFKLKLINTAVPSYVDADKDIIDLTMAIGAQEYLVKYLEELIKQINQRGYQIRAIIDFEKFRSGG